MENAKILYRAGALAPLIALILYCSQFILLFFGEPFPVTVEGWFALAQRNRLLALWYLNALDIVSFALLGLMFLALYVALRRARPAWMAIALYFALLGVVVFIVPRVLTLSLLPLSDLHAAAATEAQRAVYLAAGAALSQVGTATPQTLGFLLTTVAGLIVSVMALRSSVWSRTFSLVAGWVGILGFVVALATYGSWLAAPPISAALMPVNGLLWLVWWLAMSVGLFRLARDVPDKGANSHRQA